MAVTHTVLRCTLFMTTPSTRSMTLRAVLAKKDKAADNLELAPSSKTMRNWPNE